MAELNTLVCGTESDTQLTFDRGIVIMPSADNCAAVGKRLVLPALVGRHNILCHGNRQAVRSITPVQNASNA